MAAPATDGITALAITNTTAPATDGITALLPNDMIALIITAAPLSVINAFARTCAYWAAFVSTRANDMASARATATRTYMGLARYGASLLSNDVRHGAMTAEWVAVSHTRRRLIITYELGVAVKWEYTKMTICKTTFTMTVSQGHRDMMCFAQTDAIRRADIAAYYANGVVGTDVATGEIHVMSELPELNLCLTHPLKKLTGYIIDGELVPGVIKPWFDAVTALYPDTLSRLGEPEWYCLLAPAEIVEHFGKVDIIDLMVNDR